MNAATRCGTGIARGFSLFIGCFTLLNLVGELRRAGFDANLWWIDLSPAPAALARVILLAASVLLVAYAVRPAMSAPRRWATTALIGLLLVAALANAARFYVLVARGAVSSGFPVAFSLLVTSALAAPLVAVLRPGAPPGGPVPLVAAGLTAAACLTIFPLAQMVCFGKTDYRRPADVVVVFGARVMPDGRPSDALADRTRTACRLYLDGLARQVVFSGGRGTGPVHETAAMRQMALDMGVPEQAIVLDVDGANTLATVRNTTAGFRNSGAQRVLAVSHFYHLPRIKMAYARAGWDVHTVPARESYTLTALPYFMLREVAALWLYYLRPLCG